MTLLREFDSSNGIMLVGLKDSSFYKTWRLGGEMMIINIYLLVREIYCQEEPNKSIIRCLPAFSFQTCGAFGYEIYCSRKEKCIVSKSYTTSWFIGSTNVALSNIRFGWSNSWMLGNWVVNFCVVECTFWENSTLVGIKCDWFWFTAIEGLSMPHISGHWDCSWFSNGDQYLWLKQWHSGPQVLELNHLVRSWQFGPVSNIRRERHEFLI